MGILLPFFGDTMNISSKERTQKYRRNKKLREVNQQLKEKDLLRGEKLTSKHEEVVLRENLKLKGNEPRTRYKAYITQLIRHHYDSAENCYFFTLCYRSGAKTGQFANATVIADLKDRLIDAGIVKSLMIIPEYHKTRTSIHNHGIVRVRHEFRGDIKSELQKLWVDQYSGSLHITSLDASKRFEDYLTKFVTADKSRLYNFCDGLVTEGIDFHAIPEMKVPKSILTPIVKPYVSCIAVNTTGCTIPTGTVEDMSDDNASLGCIESDSNLHEHAFPVVDYERDIDRVKSGNRFSGLVTKAYYWYSLIFISYINLIMRLNI